MVENDDLSHYYAVHRNNLGTRILDERGFLSDVEPHASNIDSLLRKELFISEFLMSVEAIQPNQELEQGLDIAREYINVLRGRNGLSELPFEQQHVLLLEPETFDTYYQQFSGKPAKSTLGFASRLLDSVALKYDANDNAYIQTSLGFHELMHRWLEIDSRVFNTTSTDQGYQVMTEPRRSGLSVHQSNRDEHGRSYYQRGVVLNELSNYLLQLGLLNTLCTDVEHEGVFRNEIQARNQLLAEEGMNEEYALLGVQGKQVVLNRSVLHYDKNGVPLIKKYPLFPIMMQLATDLNTFCTDETNNFWEVLLSAKLDPKEQNKLRTLIDRHLGTGFFKRIKDTPYEPSEIVQLLVDIQSNLYRVK